MLSNKVYDKAKWGVQIVLPAIASLYFGLAGIWGLPNAEAVVGTLAVVATFLGVILGISSTQYKNSDRPYDGELIVSGNPGVRTYSLDLNADPYDLPDQDKVTFKIKIDE